MDKEVKQTITVLLPAATIVRSTPKAYLIKVLGCDSWMQKRFIKQVSGGIEITAPKDYDFKFQQYKPAKDKEFLLSELQDIFKPGKIPSSLFAKNVIENNNDSVFDLPGTNDNKFVPDFIWKHGVMVPSEDLEEKYAIQPKISNRDLHDFEIG